MVTNALFYVSSAVTPVLYNIMSSSFRRLFLEALGSLCRKHRPMQPASPEASESPATAYSSGVWGSPKTPELDEMQE